MKERSTSLGRQRGWAWLSWAAPAVAKLAGEALGQDDQRKSVHEQMDAQREFAQMGIRWKVADAKAAGIHPLYALGAQTHSYAPLSVGGRPNVLGEMGQDISSAIARSQTQEERRLELAKQEFRQREIDAMNNAEHQERLRGLRLENDLRQMDLRDRALGLSTIGKQINAPTQVGPGMPSNVGLVQLGDHRGRVDTGAVRLEAIDQKSRNPHSPHREAGSQPGFRRYETAPGVFRDMPAFQTDSEIASFLREAQAYLDKWVSDSFFGGAPKYIQHKSRRFEPTPGSYLMDRGFQRSGVFRKGR